jgi:hypothetical protein
MTTISFRCKACGKALRVGADKAGRRVKCPQCAAPVSVPQTGEAYRVEDQAPDRSTADDEAATQREAEEARDRKRARKAKRRERAEQAAWRKVLLGLSLIILSVVFTVILALVAFVAGLFGGERVLTILGVIGLVFQVLALVGYGLCLAVPPRHHARTFALLTLVLALAGLLVNVGSVLLASRQAAVVATDTADADDSGEEEAPRSLALQALDLAKGLLVDYGRHIAFVFFLWAVAQMYEGNDLIRDATYLLFLEGLACVWWVGDSLLSLIAPGSFAHLLGVIGLHALCGLGWRLLSLAMLVVFLRLLYNTLLVLQSKATGEPDSSETDADALRHLPVERPDRLAP